MKVTLATLVVLALGVSACGSLDADATKSEKSWTTHKVQRQYEKQLNAELFDVTASASCLLIDGEQGAAGVLKCHLEYDDGDVSTVQIDVDETGDWIANPI